MSIEVLHDFPQRALATLGDWYSTTDVDRSKDIICAEIQFDLCLVQAYLWKFVPEVMESSYVGDKIDETLFRLARTLYETRVGGADKVELVALWRFIRVTHYVDAIYQELCGMLQKYDASVILEFVRTRREILWTIWEKDSVLAKYL